MDLTDIRALAIQCGTGKARTVIELKIDSLTGQPLGTIEIPVQQRNPPAMQLNRMDIKPTWGRHDIYLVFSNKNGDTENLAAVDWVRFEQ